MMPDVLSGREWLAKVGREVFRLTDEVVKRVKDAFAELEPGVGKEVWVYGRARKGRNPKSRVGEIRMGGAGVRPIVDTDSDSGDCDVLGGGLEWRISNEPGKLVEGFHDAEEDVAMDMSEDEDGMMLN
jgi:hypothetical protein